MDSWIPCLPLLNFTQASGAGTHSSGNFNSTSKSVEVLSVSSWALALGWEKTQVPQRPDSQIGGCGWEHHSYCLSLISPRAPSVLGALGLEVS